jgi:2-polyprenyl-3-methyl-5-hydroxy-6-metoxy-1,4-benzoquinol methylase
MFPDERFEDAIEQVDKALDLTQPKGTTALDLCCGPGRCSIALARLGFSVTRVDRTKFLLEKARAKAKAAGLRIKWTQQDMRDFLSPNTFDVLLSMYTSLGVFRQQARRCHGIGEHVRRPTP